MIAVVFGVMVIKEVDVEADHLVVVVVVVSIDEKSKDKRTQSTSKENVRKEESKTNHEST